MFLNHAESSAFKLMLPQRKRILPNQSTCPLTSSRNSDANSTPPPKRKRAQDPLTKDDIPNIIQAGLEALPGSASQPRSQLPFPASRPQQKQAEQLSPAILLQNSITVILPWFLKVRDDTEHLSMLTQIVCALYVCKYC